MQRIRKCLKSSSCLVMFFFFTQTNQVAGQETNSNYLFKERITGFTIEKKDGQNTLPAAHGVELEISSLAPLNNTGDNQIKLTFYTDSWFLAPDELNTFYVKDFRGSLICTSGSILAKKPTIRILSGSAERKHNYSPAPISLDDLLSGDLSSSTETRACVRSDKAETMLPVQIPLFDDDDSRIRAFELIIPVQIMKAHASMAFHLDRIELGGFVENSGSYGNPFLEDRTIVLKKEDLSQAIQMDSIGPKEHQYLLADPVGAGSEWKLTGELKEVDENWNISYLLTHQEADLKYSGIIGIEMILMTPDGAITMDQIPVFKHIADNLAFIAQEVLVPVPVENAEIYKPIRELAYFSNKKQTGFGTGPQYNLCSYDEVLFQLWRDESEYDFFRFPMHLSQKKYPIVEGPCEISIHFPVSAMSNPFSNSQVLFKVNYLAGDDKGMLKRHTAILTFTEK